MLERKKRGKGVSKSGVGADREKDGKNREKWGESVAMINALF